MKKSRKKNRNLTGQQLKWAAGSVVLWQLVSQAACLNRKRRFLRAFVAERKPCVVITGGARGLGLGLARIYAARGANLALCSRDFTELKRAQDELVINFPQCSVIIYVCDVGDFTQVKSFIDEVNKFFGPVDLLINDAGIIQVGPYESMSHTDFEAVMNSNFWGMVNTCELIAPQMMAQGHGRIMNITSIGGVIPVPHLAPYASSKFATVGFSLTLGTELRKHGVYVTTIVPGLMRTGSFLNVLLKGEWKKEFSLFSFAAGSPLTSMKAEKAARQMVNAADRGQPFKVVGLRAKAQRVFFAMLPNFTFEMLALVDRFLPDFPAVAEKAEPPLQGGLLRSALPKGVSTKLGVEAALKYNEMGGVT